MVVDVFIGTLVLDGLDLDAGSARAVAAAVEAELARKFAGQPEFGEAPLRSGAAPRLVAEPVALVTEPALLGRRIGAAVHGGLRHG